MTFLLKFKTVISLLLVCAILLAFCPCASAQGLVPSDEIVSFIETREGYRQFAYADAGSWYIGYGINCAEDEFPDGITEEEADLMLREKLVSYADEVNNFAAAYRLSLSQNEFDALLSFTYNVGASWMKGGNRLFSYLTNGMENYSDTEIVDAIGVWGHQGRVAVGGLVLRRIAEAKIFLYGDYSGENSPEYCYLIADRNGGELENDIFCYPKGESYGSLPQPVLGDSVFAGWVTSDGKILSESDTVSKNLYVTAKWDGAASLPFTDVAADDPYYTAIQYCWTHDIMNGIGDDVFGTYGSMSRAMLATVLWRISGSPVVGGKMTFKDVEPDRYYTEAVRWAAQTGIFTGYSTEKFGTNDNITRQQLAAVLYRLAETEGLDTDTMGLDTRIFADGGDISEYAGDAAVWSANTGMFETFGGHFLPRDDAQRGQAALALMMYSELR